MGRSRRLPTSRHAATFFSLLPRRFYAARCVFNHVSPFPPAHRRHILVRIELLPAGADLHPAAFYFQPRSVVFRCTALDGARSFRRARNTSPASFICSAVIYSLAPIDALDQRRRRVAAPSTGATTPDDALDQFYFQPRSVVFRYTALDGARSFRRASNSLAASFICSAVI